MSELLKLLAKAVHKLEQCTKKQDSMAKEVVMARGVLRLRGCTEEGVLRVD